VPFSRVVFAFEEPLFVRADASDAEVESHRAELTRRLVSARERARAACGVEIEEKAPPVAARRAG
jgi:hypothetical protein